MAAIRGSFVFCVLMRKSFNGRDASPIYNESHAVAVLG